MITIQKTNLITPPAKINNNKNYNNYNTLNPKDTVTFTGLQVKRAQSYKEVKELVNLFYDALKHNIEPNSKQLGFIDKIIRNISTIPFVLTAKHPKSITEAVKSGDKLIGGYSLNIVENETSHLGFITLAPEVMKTKTGIETLKLMGKRICEALESNNIDEMTWTTNARNTPINNLLKRLNAAEKERLAFSETEYIISLEQLKKHLTNI